MYIEFNKNSKCLYIGDIEIKPREVIICFGIIALMTLFGLFLKNTIVEAMVESNNVYYRAIQINDEPKLFKQAIDTDVGNALVYGTAKASPPVIRPEVKGEYMYLEKIQEHYTRHTRTVTYKDSNGNTKRKQEVTYSWDFDGSEKLKSENIEFLGVTFKNTLIGTPVRRLDLKEVYITDTDGSLRHDGYVYTSDHDRWYMKYTPKEISGTIEGSLKRQGIKTFDGEKDSIIIHPETKIEMLIHELKSSEQFTETVFNIIWVVTTIIIVTLFLICENRWLDNKKVRRRL